MVRNTGAHQRKPAFVLSSWYGPFLTMYQPMFLEEIEEMYRVSKD